MLIFIFYIIDNNKVFYTYKRVILYVKLKTLPYTCVYKTMSKCKLLESAINFSFAVQSTHCRKKYM